MTEDERSETIAAQVEARIREFVDVTVPRIIEGPLNAFSSKAAEATNRALNSGLRIAYSSIADRIQRGDLTTVQQVYDFTQAAMQEFASEPREATSEPTAIAVPSPS